MELLALGRAHLPALDIAMRLRLLDVVHALDLRFAMSAAVATADRGETRSVLRTSLRKGVTAATARGCLPLDGKAAAMTMTAAAHEGRETATVTVTSATAATHEYSSAAATAVATASATREDSSAASSAMASATAMRLLSCGLTAAMPAAGLRCCRDGDRQSGAQDRKAGTLHFAATSGVKSRR